MKRNSKILAKFVTVLFILCVLMCQVVFAENGSQSSANEVFTYTRLMLTAVITVIGGIVLCISFYKNSKNQKK